MESIPEKETLFNRYIAGEMSKEELTELVKRLLPDKGFRQWFTVQVEFLTLLRDLPKPD